MKRKNSKRVRRGNKCMRYRDQKENDKEREREQTEKRAV